MRLNRTSHLTRVGGSIVWLVIPVQRMALHLWTSGRQYPVKVQLDILHQMACNLDVADICRVIQWTNVIVLEDTVSLLASETRSQAFDVPCGIEVVHVTRVGEVIVDILNLCNEGASLSIGIANSTKTTPERLEVTTLAGCRRKVERTTYEDDDLCIWPGLMNAIDQIQIAVIKHLAGHIVGSVVIIRS